LVSGNVWLVLVVIRRFSLRETLCPSAFVAFVFLHCSEFLLISYEGLHWLKKIKKIGNEVLDQLPRYRLLDALLSMLIDLLRSATPITDYRIPDY